MSEFVPGSPLHEAVELLAALAHEVRLTVPEGDRKKHEQLEYLVEASEGFCGNIMGFESFDEVVEYLRRIPGAGETPYP